MRELASVDGTISPREEARVPVTDDGLLRGDGAFEVIRLYGGRPFALEDHLARLERSLAGLRLTTDAGALRAEVAALLAAAGGVEALLRIVITRGGRRILSVEVLPPRPEALRLASVRYAPGRVLDGLKTLSYGANMLAGRLAREQGADDALLVTPHGRVLEAPTSSFFWVRQGILRTPPLSERILASVTRARLLDELDVREEPCVLDELEGAEEAFVASTVREVMPVRAIDGLTLPAAPGAVTREAAARLTARIARELAAAVPA